MCHNHPTEIANGVEYLTGYYKLLCCCHCRVENRKMTSSVKSQKKKPGRQKTHRYTSNVFSVFNQPQIQEFKVNSLNDLVVTSMTVCLKTLPKYNIFRDLLHWKCVTDLQAI